MSWIDSDKHNQSGDEEQKHPFSKWMGRLFLLASVLLLIYTYYRAEITFQGDNSAGYFKYYLISMTSILFWVVVLQLREGLRANIVTIIISLWVGLYLVEGGLNFMGLGQISNRVALEEAAAVEKKEIRVKTATDLGVEFDQRTKLEVIEDLISEGVDAVPAIRPRDVLTMDV